MPDQMIQSLIKASEKLFSDDDFDWMHECSDEYDYYYDDKNGSNILKPNSKKKKFCHNILIMKYKVVLSPFQ